MAGVKKVLLFSSGMDSLILKSIYDFKNEECLFVRIGTDENRIEEKLIDKYYPGVQKTDLLLNEFELPNKIIPFRNHHLALLGAQFGTAIYFAFTAGDTTKDKDFVFKSQMEGMLNYFSIDEDKVHYPGPYSIEMPFKNKTKTQIVELYLSNGYPIDNLMIESSSCYAGLEKPCGKCRSCLRKYVAMKLNGFDMKDYFQFDPNLYLQNFLEESIRKNRKTEINDIQKCINQK